MKITVVVTVYNISQYLPRFFDSIQTQSYEDYTLLIIDDGSDDDSLEICKKYAECDSRIRVVSLKHVGIAKARNIAMTYIDSEFTVYVDGDDFVDKDYLKHLVDAQEKYNSDLVISRVAYLAEEDNRIEGVFPERGEMFIPKSDFATKLPMIIEDRRFNYLYGKIYRTDLLKHIRVEDDVRQGSDTMINCQYIKKANSIVLIDNLDYNYIKYSQRSVTSYNGEDAFERICRINRYLQNEMRAQELYTKDMDRVIVGRVLISAVWCIDRIMSCCLDRGEKEKQISLILNNSFYVEAYESCISNNYDYQFDVIAPQNGRAYIDKHNKRIRIVQIKSKLLSVMPDSVVRLYHKIKGIED